tara:strand:+ start:64 stop:342 length:279 start_codon:yes stop_codon:yes gene_type:complete
VRTAVFGPGVVVVSGVKRKLFSVTHGSHPVFSDPQFNQVPSRYECATLAKGQVVLRGAALVTVTFDSNDPARKSLQHLGIALDDSTRPVIEV